MKGRDIWEPLSGGPTSLIKIELSQMASVEGVCGTTCSGQPHRPVLMVNHVKPSIDHSSICAQLTNLRINPQEMWPAPLRTFHINAYLK